MKVSGVWLKRDPKYTMLPELLGVPGSGFKHTIP